MAHPEFISLTQTLIFQLSMGVVIQNIIYSFKLQGQSPQLKSIFLILINKNL